MNVVARATLRAFWQRHPQSRGPLEAWFADVRQATWNGPADVKADFGNTVDFVADNRVSAVRQMHANLVHATGVRDHTHHAEMPAVAGFAGKAMLDTHRSLRRRAGWMNALF